MKQLLLAAATAVLTLASCQSTGDSTTTSTPKSTVGGGERGIRLAYVRIDSLTKQYTYFQELSQELGKEEDEVFADLQGRQAKLQQDVAAFQEAAGNMSPRNIEQRQQELYVAQQQYLAVEQASQERLMRKQQDLTLQLKEDMDKAIGVLKEELNLDFILLYEEGGQIIYANTDFDITEQMVTLLNENRAKAGSED